MLKKIAILEYQATFPDTGCYVVIEYWTQNALGQTIVMQPIYN